MSFFRVTNPDVSAFDIPDLGISVGASVTDTLSDRFTVKDLYISADLEAAIINGDLTVEINYGTGFTAVAAVDYTNRDCLAAFLNVYEITNENNNEDLVDGSDASANSLHMHDSRYYTETELGGTGGAALIGVDDTNFTNIPTPITTLQQFADAVDDIFTAFDLDNVYDNDVDGILNVDGVTKPLNFRSNNVNDILISRTNTVVDQNALLFDVSADELILGSLAVGVAPNDLNQIDVRVLSNLIVDGDITFTGTITDQTVTELNVTNATIELRSGAVTDANASLCVFRPVAGTDACLTWDETADRWKAGLSGAEQTIALLEANELVSGIWEFQGGGSTDPSLYLTDKATAPTTNLGAAGQIAMSMINNELAYYDQTRAKWLGVARLSPMFSGRNNQNNSNEYMRIGEITTNQAGWRVTKNMTIVGIGAQTRDAETWTVEVRKNDAATVIASLVITAASGGQAVNLNVDVNAGDELQLYINGSNISAPTAWVELAPRY